MLLYSLISLRRGEESYSQQCRTSLETDANYPCQDSASFSSSSFFASTTSSSASNKSIESILNALSPDLSESGLGIIQPDYEYNQRQLETLKTLRDNVLESDLQHIINLDELGRSGLRIKDEIWGKY